MSLLEKIIMTFVGEDKYRASEMMSTALLTKTQNAPGHVWADYLFLAACYSSAAGDVKTVKHAVEQITQDFPNYDPSPRFSWKSAGLGDLAPEDVREGSTRWETFRYKARVIGAMNQFCERHPDFSFGEALGEYFPSTRRMGIKSEEGPG